MAEVTITDIYYDDGRSPGMWVAIVDGFPPVNGVLSDRQAFSQQAVENRMAIYDCTAEEAVAAMVNEVLVNIENQTPTPTPIAVPATGFLSVEELYRGMTLPLPPLSASARQMISRIEDQIRNGYG